MPSAEIYIDGVSIRANGYTAGGGQVVSFALHDRAGVSTLEVHATSSDDKHVASAVEATITVDQVTMTGTFTMPTEDGLGQAFLMQAVANRGLATETTFPFGVFVPAANGVRVGALNQVYEGDAAFGTLPSFNEALRNATPGAAPTTHGPVEAATTAALPSNTYSSTGGGTITANSPGAWSPTNSDEVALASGDDVLVKDEPSGAHDGVYTLTDGTVSTPWSLTRRADLNSAALLEGCSITVKRGAKNRKTFVLVTTPITLGTTPLRWIETSPTVDARLLAAADDSTDDTTNLQASFLVAPEVVYTGSSNYKVATTAAIGSAASVHRFPASTSMVHATSSATSTMHGQIVAPPRQIFKVDAGALILLPDMLRVEAAWWGAKGDGTQDDAPAINAAIASIQAVGGMVHHHRPTNGYFSIRTPVVIGTISTDSQGVLLVFDRATYEPSSKANYLADASMAKGAPMLLIQNTIRVGLDGMNIDGNGNADLCAQTRSDSFGGRFPNWHTVLENVTVRNARVYDFLTGETAFFATCNPSTDTFAAAGHPLQNGDVVFLAPHHALAVLPASAGGTLDALFFVVNRIEDGTTHAGISFQLSLTLGGSAVDFTTAGVGIWTVEKSLRGDCSAMRAESVQFGGRTVAAHGVAKYCQKGYETFGNTMRGCWFQGEPSPTLGFTANASTDVLTLSGGTLADGDICIVYNFTTSDVLPAGALSAVTHVGSGSPAVTVSGTPADTRGVTLTISTGGALGVGYFTYSIGGNTAIGPVRIPGGGTFALPNGVTATFAAGTYVATDTYSWTVNGGLARGTEYVWSNISGTTGKLLASIGGSAIDLVTAGSGTLKIQKISGDTLYGIRLFEGEITVGASFVGFYKDVYATGVHGSQGWKLHVESCSSQSFQFLHASSRGITMTPQEGGCELDGVAHTGGGFLGCQNSIYWDMPFYSSLLVDGGLYFGDIHLGVGSNSAVELKRPTLPASALSTPTVTGDRTYLHGEWQENTILKTWHPSLVSQSSISAVTDLLASGQLFIGPDEAAQVLEVAGDGYFLGSGAANLQSGSGGVNITAGGGNILVLPHTGSGFYDFSDSHNWGNHTQVPQLTMSHAGTNGINITWTYSGDSVYSSPTKHQVVINGVQAILADTTGLTLGSATIASGLYGTKVTRPARVGQLTSGAGTPSGTTTADVGSSFNQTTLNNNFATVVARLNALEASQSAAGGGFGGTA